MSFIPAVNGAKSVIKCSLYGQDVINTLWTKFSTQPGDTELDNLNDGLDLWLDGLFNLSSNRFSAVSVTSTDQTVQNSNQRAKQLDQVGTQSGAALPGNVALVITLLTGQIGRTKRGRFYTSGIAQDSSDSSDKDALSASNLTAYLAWFGGIFDILGDVTGSPELVIASKVLNGVARATALLTTVQDVTANVFYDSQRRRLHGRGK